MIGNINTSDYSYMPLARGGGDATPESQANQPKSREQGFPFSSDTRRNPAAESRDVQEDKGAASNKAKTQQLSDAELAVVRELKQRDRQVRQHEMAHIAASGGLAQGGPSYAYQRGPDGQNYAIGGQVHLDISPGKTPEETLQKAQTIQAAAVAPAEPSGQDRAIAAKASQMAMQARLELNQQEGAEKNGLSQRDEDSPARRLAQRFLSAVTPQPEPFIQLAA